MTLDGDKCKDKRSRKKRLRGYKSKEGREQAMWLSKNILSRGNSQNKGPKVGRWQHWPACSSLCLRKSKQASVARRE